MAKHNKNNSRELDAVGTPEYHAEIQRIRDSWRLDFGAFCLEKLKVVDKTATTTPIIPLAFNQCQQALSALVERIGDFQEMRTRRLSERDASVQIVRYPVEVVILKARKVGVSTWCEARGYWRAQLFRAQKGLVMAHERPAAQNIMDIMQRFDTLWPPNEYPITKAPIKRMSDDLLEWHPEHGSSVVVETAGTKGGGSSRSFTYQFVHMSEVAFFPNDSPQVAAALSARATYHETYLESTANGVGNMFHDEWENAMWIDDVEKLWAASEPLPKWWNGKFRFFWPWYSQDENSVSLEEYEEKYILETLDEEEQTLVDEYQLTASQLAWRRREIAGPCSKQNIMSPVQYFKQEHPTTSEEAFVNKSSALYDTKKLNAMSALSKDVKPAFLGYLLRDSSDASGFKLVSGGRFIVSEQGAPQIEGAQFVQWEKPDSEQAYVIGVDTAEGTEKGDWSVLSLFSRTNGTLMREVARYRAKTPAREMGEIAAFLGAMYNDAYIVCERNAPGNSTCEKLIELGYGNMYHHRNIEQVTNHENPEAFTAGFRTTSTTKPMICERAVQGLRDDEILIRHPDALREWKAFSRIDRKYSGPEGINDDCVMADLLAFFGMSEAPPLDASNTTSVDYEPNLSSEEKQDRYWAKRMAEKRAYWAKRHEADAANSLRKSGRLPFSDIFN